MGVSLNKTKSACRIGDEKAMLVPAARVNGVPSKRIGGTPSRFEVITPTDLKRAPRRTAAAKVLGLKNGETVRGFADTLSGARRQLHMCRDGTEFVIFCFLKPSAVADGPGAVQTQNDVIWANEPV